MELLQNNCFSYGVSAPFVSGTPREGLLLMKRIKEIYHKCREKNWLCVMFTVILFILVAYGVVGAVQYILNVGTSGMIPEIYGLNVLCVVTIFLVLYSIGLKTKLSLIAGGFLCLILATANYYTYTFRGTEMLPLDILAIRTAMSVAGNYTYSFGKNVVFPWTLFVMMSIGTFIIPEARFKSRWKPRLAAGFISMIVFLLLLYGSGSYKSNSWASEGSRENGYIFNFMLQIKELYVEKPENYSIKEVEVLSEKYSLRQNVNGKTPDIIVIMDETFSDLGVLGIEPRTNQEVTPFIDSLSENTVKGTMAVSVIGGGTSTSEYEVLTGNTHLFLENASSSYQQYVGEGSYSVVSDMKQKGYKCIGMHPFNPGGWGRSDAYDHMGFDETYFLEDFPRENIIRNYVSDQEMFEFIVKKYEENKFDGKQDLFLFGVTIQNHGGYTYDKNDFEYKITLNGYESEYRDAEQYLTLLYETDQAVEYLLNYFQKEEREVIVVFFGDHQPSLTEEFLTEISDVDYDTPEERLRRYTVPYFIWANYDIQEKETDMLSLNYLMNEVYLAAGMELPPYQQFLSEMRSEIPFMNRYAYYSKEKQAFLHLEDAEGKEKEFLDLYWRIQYNNMFDKRNRNEILFPFGK